MHTPGQRARKVFNRLRMGVTYHVAMNWKNCRVGSSHYRRYHHELSGRCKRRQQPSCGDLVGSDRQFDTCAVQRLRELGRHVDSAPNTGSDGNLCVPLGRCKRRQGGRSVCTTRLPKELGTRCLKVPNGSKAILKAQTGAPPFPPPNCRSGSSEERPDVHRRCRLHRRPGTFGLSKCRHRQRKLTSSAVR